VSLRNRASVFAFAALLSLLGILSACGGAPNGNSNSDPSAALIITSQPANEAVTAGQAATFTVVAAGAAPLSYQWYQNSAPVGSNSSTYTTAPATAANNQAQIQVRISDPAGSATSNTVTLTVNAVAAGPPTITTQPANEVVTAGQSATFTVVAAGAAPLSYQWYQNGAAVGSNSATYTTALTTPANNLAQIQVTISNPAGTVTSDTVTLTVNAAAAGAPTITTQPVNEVVTAGQAATFAVVAAGAAPLNYQWYQNGAAVGSNSTTYTTAPTTAANNLAQIQVSITNPAGTVASNTVTLTVNAASGANTTSCTTSIQTLVDASPAGTTFTLPAGTCRMQSVTPKDGDVFIGQSGTILNGSTLISTFSQETISGVSYWVASGPSQPGTINGTCDTAHPMCMYPEDFFINDQPLLRVASLSAVTTGTCYFDYSAAKVYFVDDPTGKTVEVGTTTHAFSGSATNVTIKGLTIEKYAAPAQDGAISGGAWTIESNQILLNHGGAIRLASSQIIQSNYIHHNGQEGLTGSGSNILVENNEIAYNNTLGFDFSWEAGGTKFSNTTNLIVQGNYVHDNNGPGLSLDFQTYNWLIQGNRTSGNAVAGILDEISYDGTARYNIIENDASYPGMTNPTMWWACGFFDLDSSNATVYGNTLINNSNGICAVSISRGSGNRGTFLVQNLSVYDNVIVQSVGSAAGAVADSGSYLDVYASSSNNLWTSNTYQLAASDPAAYDWQGGSSYVSMDASQWQSFGQDTAGTWISPTDTTFPSAKFTPNQAVSTVGSAQVWSLPTTTSTLVTTEVSGAQGTITQVAGPIFTGGAWWWNVTYADGTVGWSEEANLGSL
jgi:hypothetical protein